MASWEVQDAKIRFCDLLDAALEKGPQIVTRRGIETAVLVPVQKWSPLTNPARPSLKDLLLGPGPRFENVCPRRGSLRRRSVVQCR